MSLKIVVAEITTMNVDAIINETGVNFARAGGVYGAIHRAAGPGLAADCEKIGTIAPGEAVITPGHNLRARNVIHTVGPVWQGGGAGEAEILAQCYRNSFQQAEAAGCVNIAVPAISTGLYGFPAAQAARIAIQECLAWQAEHEKPSRIFFCCFTEDCALAHRTAMSGLG